MSTLSTNLLIGFEAMHQKDCGMSTASWPLDFLKRVAVPGIDRIFSASSLAVPVLGLVLNFNNGSLVDCFGNTLSLSAIKVVYIVNTGSVTVSSSSSPASLLPDQFIYPGQHIAAINPGTQSPGGIELELTVPGEVAGALDIIIVGVAAA